MRNDRGADAAGVPRRRADDPAARSTPAGPDAADAVTPVDVAEAIDAWNVWEAAINTTRPPNVPAWMRANGRRWADPGE